MKANIILLDKLLFRWKKFNRLDALFDFEDIMNLQVKAKAKSSKYKRLPEDVQFDLDEIWDKAVNLRNLINQALENEEYEIIPALEDALAVLKKKYNKLNNSKL